MEPEQSLAKRIEDLVQRLESREASLNDMRRRMRAELRDDLMRSRLLKAEMYALGRSSILKGYSAPTPAEMIEHAAVTLHKELTSTPSPFGLPIDIVFEPRQLLSKAVELFPGHKQRLKQGLWSAIKTLCKGKKIERCPGGYRLLE